MARKYSKSASKDVKRAMHKKKRGTLKSGRSGEKVTSHKQAIAIGLSAQCWAAAVDLISPSSARVRAAVANTVKSN